MAKSCWITGASSGIGRSTAISFVKRGYTVFASARSLDKLTSLKKECASLHLKGKIIIIPLDVTNLNEVSNAIKVINTYSENLDYILLNAGTFIREDSKTLSVKNTKLMIDLNYIAVINIITLLQDYFTQLNIKQVAVVSSIAAWRGMPMAAAYCSSKAALKTALESIALDYSHTDIMFRLFYPGFVETPLTDKNNFKMPFIIKSEEAGEKIYKGIIESKRFEISFPLKFALFMKVISSLPWPIYKWIMLNKIKK